MQFTQMTISKKLLVFAFSALFPLCGFAQIGQKYIIAPGDKTIIVNKVNKGIYGSENKFLRKDKKYSEKDIYFDSKSSYRSLEEAAYSTSNLLKKVEKQMAESEDNNESLSFRLSAKFLKQKSEEREARMIADSLMRAEIDKNAKQLAEAYTKFGNRPTFYLNGVEIPESYIDYLKPKDVLSRVVKATGALSGNPNGEIWMEITPSAAKRIKLESFKPAED